jgi:hypothetical protein
MTPERPSRPRRKDTESTAVLYQFTAVLLRPEDDPYNGVRIGRPERSPSLPPPDDDREAKPPTDPAG